MQVNEARMLAMGYAWGRQDAGDAPRSTDAAHGFAAAFAERQQAYSEERPGVHFMPNVRDAFNTYQRTGQIV